MTSGEASARVLYAEDDLSTARLVEFVYEDKLMLRGIQGGSGAAAREPAMAVAPIKISRGY